MDLKELKKNWNDFAKTDPLWAILSEDPDTKRKWEIEEFFTTGYREIESIMDYVNSLGINLSKGTALDFGCGVGRLTQALAHYFDQCYGVDIAPTMINLANRYNRHGEKCQYIVNPSDDLRIFSDDSFDFIYTNIVLQHMEPKYSLAYIKEFLRIMKSNGLLIFQLPSQGLGSRKIRQLIKRIVPSPVLDGYRKLRSGSLPIMEMHCIRKKKVIKFIESNGGRVCTPWKIVKIPCIR